MANWFTKLFGAKEKRNETIPQQFRPQSIAEFPSYKSARDLLASYKTPEAYIPFYEEQVIKPQEKLAKSRYYSSTLPMIEDISAGKYGTARTSRTGDTALETLQNLYRDLDIMGGETRTKALETGFGERGKQLAGYQSLLGPEMEQAGKQNVFDIGNIDRELKERQSREAADAQVLPNIISTGANIAGAIGGFGQSQALQKILQQLILKGQQGGDFMLGSAPYTRSAITLGG